MVMSKFVCLFSALLLALSLNAQSIEKKLEAVDDYIIEGNFEYAEKLLVKILRRDEGIHVAHYKLATVFWQTNKPKKALEEAVKAVQQKPENANYQALLGKLWLENSQYEKALEAFDAALLYDEQLPEVFLYRGDYFAEIEDWDQALADYEVLATLVSEDPEIFFRLGHSYHGKQQYKKAVRHYEKALRLNPLDHESRFGLAVCQYNNQIYSDAIFQLDQLINMNGEFIDYLYQRALCFIEVKQLAKAKTDLLKARELEKHHLDVNYALIGVEERLGNLDQALVLLDKTIARFGSLHVLYMWKGRILAKKGSFKESYRNYVFASESENGTRLAYQHYLNTHKAIISYLAGEAQWMPMFSKCSSEQPYTSFIATCADKDMADFWLNCLTEKDLQLFAGDVDPLSMDAHELFIKALHHLHIGDRNKATKVLDDVLAVTSFEDSEYHFAMILMTHLSAE